MGILKVQGLMELGHSFSSAFNATTGSASINGSTINQVIGEFSRVRVLHRISREPHESDVSTPSQSGPTYILLKR